MSQFWKPKPGTEPRIVDDEEGGVLFFSAAASSSSSSGFGYGSMEKQRQRLPVFKYRTAILYLVETHATTIIVGETGSGKTTQIPQYLKEAGWADGGRLIACSQPRRLAVQLLQGWPKRWGSNLERKLVTQFDLKILLIHTKYNHDQVSNRWGVTEGNDGRSSFDQL